MRKTPPHQVTKGIAIANVKESVERYKKMMEVYDALSEEEKKTVDVFNMKLIKLLDEKSTLSDIDKLGDSPMEEFLREKYR